MTKPARESLAAALFCFAGSLVWLRPATTLGTLGDHLQNHDSAISAAVTAHVARWSTGHAALFELGMFYPRTDAYTCSDTFLLPGLLTAPFQSLLGPVVCWNLYLIFAAVATTFSAWLWLRFRPAALGFLPALLGAMVAGWNVDRAYHFQGQGHLLFQAGFPLGALALEHILKGRRVAAWGPLLAAVSAMQAAQGINTLLLYVGWLGLLVPVAWVQSEGKVPQRLMRLLHSAAWMAVGLAVHVPIVMGYLQRTSGRSDVPLEELVVASATLGGYMLPPRDPAQALTLTGAMLSACVTGPSHVFEDVQYVGVLSCVLALFGLAATPRPRRRIALLFVCIGIVAFVLSLGPYTHEGYRLPLYHLYSCLPPIRFFRAPSRYAFLVQWSLAPLAAMGLAAVLRRLVACRRRRWAIPAGWAALAIMAADTFPVFTPQGPYPGHPAEVTRLLMATRDQGPWVEVPAPGQTEFGDFTLADFVWHQGPMVNGASGYFPPTHFELVSKCVRDFPSTRSLMLADWYQVRRVLVRGTSQAPARQQAAACSQLTLEWQSEQAAMYSIRSPGLWQETLTARESMTASLPTTSIAGAKRTGAALQKGHVWRVDTPPMRFALDTTAPIATAGIDTATVVVRIRGAAPWRENARLIWSNPEDRDDRGRSMDRTVRADGTWQTVTFPLRQHPLWVSDKLAMHIHFLFGNRPGDEVEIRSLRWNGDSDEHSP